MKEESEFDMLIEGGSSPLDTLDEHPIDGNDVQNVVLRRSKRSLGKCSVSNLLIKDSSKRNPPKEIPLEDLYLQKNALAHFKETPLETIFESPRVGVRHNTCSLMTKQKLRRQCKFTKFDDPPKFKIIKRRKRINKRKLLVGSLSSGKFASLEPSQKAWKGLLFGTKVALDQDYQKEDEAMSHDANPERGVRELSDSMSSLQMDTSEDLPPKLNQLSLGRVVTSPEASSTIDDLAPLTLDFSETRSVSRPRRRRSSNKFNIPKTAEDSASPFAHPAPDESTFDLTGTNMDGCISKNSNKAKRRRSCRLSLYEEDDSTSLGSMWCS